MTPSNFINDLRQSIKLHLEQGNRPLAACLSRVLRYLPATPTAAIAMAIDGGLDDYFIAQLKQTFR